MGKKLSAKPFGMEQLEPRLMFAADLEPITLDGGRPHQNGLTELPVIETDLVPSTLESQSGAVVHNLRHELLFIDTRVPDYQNLVTDLLAKHDDGRQIEVVILDSSRDGIEQISEVLSKYQDIDAVHLVSHGTDGAVQLGNTWLNLDTLDTYADDIEGWKYSLNGEADLLFYGCDLAAGEDGRALIDNLTILTGVDVAASDDFTGSALLGGDWDLEYIVGDIETGIAFSADVQQAWTDVLAISVDNTTSAAVENGGPSLSWSHTVNSGSNGILIVNVSFMAADGAVTSVKYGGTALTLLGSAEKSGGGNIRTEMWYLKAPAAGTANVAITMDASMTFTGGATNFFGVDQTTPTGTFTGVTGGGHAPSVTVASAAGELVIDAVADRAGVSGTVGASQTEQYRETIGGGGGAVWGSSSTEAGAASVTMDWSLSGSGAGEWAVGAVALKPVLNAAPVNSGPSAQNTDKDTALVFSSTNGNQISVSDVDAGNNLLQISLTANNGTLTLSQIDGLSFVSGTGTGDVSMVFTGTLNNLNNALEGLIFQPDTGYSGPASIDIVTSDLGSELFGYDTVFGSSTTLGDFDKQQIATQVILPVDGEITSITAYLTNNEANPVRFGLYTDTAGEPDSLIVESAEVTLPIGTGWYSINLPTTPLTADTYWLAISPGKEGAYFFDSTGGQTRHSNYDPKDGFAAPWSGTYENNTRKVSAFASFTPNGASIESDTDTINVTVVNDAPTATNLSAPETFTEDTPLNLTDIVVTDVDGDPVTVTLTLSDVTAGSLSTATSGAVTSTFVGGVWTASGAIADVNNLLAGVTFTPSLNYNSNFTIATSVHDGIASPITGVKNMTGTAQNDAPTATNLSAPETYTEDTALNLTNIVVTDVDSANVTVTLTLSDVAAGSLSTGTSGAVTSTFIGGVWTASGAIADVNTLLAGVTFNPALNYNSNFTIAISVDDGVAAAITGTKNMTGTAQNDAPTATNLSAGETYTEDTALNLTDIVVTDVDSANVTVTLTLSDVAAGSLSTGTSGAVTSTFIGGVWTASGAIADVNTLLAGVTFTPSLNYNANFTIATSVDDGVASAITGTKNMTGTAQNDAPTATNLSAPETYTVDTPLNLTDIVVTDVDGDPVTVTLTLSDVTAGSLSTATSGAVTSTFVGGVWTASGAIADVNTLLAGIVYTPTLSYSSNFTIATSVDDGVASAITGTKNMTVVGVNNAPTATNLSAGETYTEDTPLNLTDIVVTDVDGDPVTVTLTLSDVAAGSLSTGTSGAVTSTFVGGVWTASGTIADVNTLLAGVTFNPALNYNSNFTIATSVDDGVASAITGTKNMTGTAQNDAPTATNLSAGETYTEDTALNLTNIVVTDVDSANVTVTLTLSDVAAGSLSTGTSGAVTSTFIGGVWTASGAIADVNTLLAGVTFNPALNYNSNFTIATNVDDGVASAITGTKNMTGTAQNDAPTATNLSAGETYTEDTALNLTNIVVTDVDSANVTVTLTLSDVAAGSLSTGTSGAVASTFVGGVWTASGAIADVNTLLAGVTFNPALNYNSNFTIATSVDDGVASAITGTKNMTVTAQNDAPTATNLSAPETYTEDTALNLTNIVVTDVDSANVTVTLTLSDVAAGSLSTGTSGAVTSTFVGGVWTASGAIADVNTLLAGVTFNPALNYNSNFTIAISVDDGVASAITGTKNMTGTAQNDAPTATNLSAGETYTEDTALNLTNIVVTDVDSANVTVTLTLSDVAAGSLSTGTSGAVASTFVGGVWTASGAIADVNTLLAGVTFNPALNYNSNFTIATSVDDGVASAITGTKNMTVTAQNDAPTATNLSAPETYTEDTALNLTNIVVTDVDSANVTVTLTLSDVAAGSLSTGTSGAVTSTFVGGVWTASGAIADVNTLLAGVTFNPALNYNSNFTIAISVDDGVASAITGTKNMTGTAQNDAPTATNLSAPETYTEDTALNLTNIVVTDVDSANVTVTLTLSDVAAGSLSTGTSGAVTSTFIGGVWTASGTIADVNTLLAGVTFTPSLNYNTNFTIATSVDDSVAPAIKGIKIMTGTAVGDTPQVGNITTFEETQSGLIIIDRDVNDGAEVTYFRISNITNGTLYRSDGVTQINNGDYITFAEAQVGVRFTPATNSTANGSFSVESSEDGSTVAAQSGTATSTITVLFPADVPTDDTPPDDDVGDNEDVPDDTKEDVTEENELPGNVDDKKIVQKINVHSGKENDSQDPGKKNTPETIMSPVNTTGKSHLVEKTMIAEQPVLDEESQIRSQEQNVRQDLIFRKVLNRIETLVDAIKKDTDKEIQFDKNVIASSVAVSTGLSVGYVVWLLKGGSLLSSVLSSLPAWHIADPMPILTQKKEYEDDEESLETIIKNESQDKDKKEKKSDIDDGESPDSNLKKESKDEEII